MAPFRYLVTFWCAFQAAQSQNVIYTSGYSESIQTFTLDLEHGKLTPLKSQICEPSMTWISVEPTKGEYFYAAHEVNDYEGFGNSGALSRWRVDLSSDTMFEKIQTVSSYGAGPCHVHADTTNGFLHISDYVSGTYTAYQVDTVTSDIMDLSFTESYGQGSNVVPDRQADSHAHGVFTFNEFVYVLDLGSDKIWHYKVQDGKIVKAEPAFSSTPPGFGPRHMAINKETATAYVVYELQSYIDVFVIDKSTGELTQKFQVDLLPDSIEDDAYPYEAAAEIEISPDNLNLYASNRGTGSIVVFTILPDDNLEFVQIVYLGGSSPRHFKIHPNGKYMVTALQQANLLELYEIVEGGFLVLKDTVQCPNAPTVVAYL